MKYFERFFYFTDLALDKIAAIALKIFLTYNLLIYNRLYTVSMADRGKGKEVFINLHTTQQLKITCSSYYLNNLLIRTQINLT
jgi:hypothetical protein